MKVCKIFRFDAAHFLPNYEGKCANMHGHSWVLEVEVIGPIQPDGMIVDFAILKKLVNTEVIDTLDHRVLNQIKGLDNPTCENILLWVAEHLTKHNDLYHEISRLRLYETPDAFAEITF